MRHVIFSGFKVGFQKLFVNRLVNRANPRAANGDWAGGSQGLRWDGSFGRAVERVTLGREEGGRGRSAGSGRVPDNAIHNPPFVSLTPKTNMLRITF